MGMKDIEMLMGLEQPKSQKYPAKKAGRNVTPLTDGADEPEAIVEQKEPEQAFEVRGARYVIDRTTPRPTRSLVTGSAYEELFDALKIGQSVLCESPRHAQKLSGALQMYLRRKDKPHLMASLAIRCPDGKSRVYLVARKGEKK